MEKYPVRSPKKRKPIRYGTVYFLLNKNGQVLIRRREERGLLGGMMEFPSTEWLEAGWQKNEAIGNAPVATDWEILSGAIKHTFTHFHLELRVLKGMVGEAKILDGVWCEPGKLNCYALPTVMKKVWARATKSLS